MQIRNLNINGRSKYFHFCFIVNVWLILTIASPAIAQFKLTKTGAMAALNDVSVAAPPNPAVSSFNPATAASVIINTPSTTKPIFVGAGKVTIPPINDKTLGFTYRSPLTWYNAYFNYRQAAEGLDISPVELIRNFTAITNATGYILNDANFIWFQNYSPRRATMIIRTNDPVPARMFEKPLQINGGLIENRTYAPNVSAWYLEVPLSF